jgi:hypothetical protein
MQRARAQANATNGMKILHLVARTAFAKTSLQQDAVLNKTLRYELARLALAALWRGSARFGRGADVAFNCSVAAAYAAEETSKKSVRMS